MNETRQINGDAAVSGNVAVGGDAMVRGDMTIDHGLKVKGWVDIANLNFPAVGVFKTGAELTNSVTPKHGYIAGVIEDSDTRTGYRVRLWTANGTEWEASNPARYLDVSVVINMTTSIEGIDAEDFAEWQQQIGETLDQKANLEDMVIQTTTGLALIQLRPGVYVQVLTAHQDISGKADKVVHPVGGNFVVLGRDGGMLDSGVKPGDFLREHQDISGKADKSEMIVTDLVGGEVRVQLKSGATVNVYTPEAVRGLLGRAVGDAVTVTFTVASKASYNLLGEGFDESAGLRLVVVDGVGYTSAKDITLTPGTITVQYVFADAAEVPARAFAGLNGDLALTEVYLPSFVKKIGDEAFANDGGLQRVVCEAMTPPEVEENTFGGVDVGNVTLAVHKVAASVYAADDFWRIFRTN